MVRQRISESRAASCFRYGPFRGVSGSGFNPDTAFKDSDADQHGLPLDLSSEPRGNTLDLDLKGEKCRQKAKWDKENLIGGMTRDHNQTVQKDG